MRSQHCPYPQDFQGLGWRDSIKIGIVVSNKVLQWEKMKNKPWDEPKHERTKAIKGKCSHQTNKLKLAELRYWFYMTWHICI